MDTTYVDQLETGESPDAAISSLDDRTVGQAQDDRFIRDTGGGRLSDREFIDRSVEENRFWLRIMMEHAFFLRIALPDDAAVFVKQASAYEEAFDALLHRALHEPVSKAEDAERLNDETIRLVTEAMAFKQEVFDRNANGDYRWFNWTKTAEHIRREPLFVIKTLKRLNGRIERPLREELVEDNEFYLKIMAEHGAFMAHFLDPDEDDLIDIARLACSKFKVLTVQARNVEIEPPSRTALLSQLTIFRGATLFFHGFSEEIHRLTQEKALRGILDPNLTGHITREAAKYLAVLDRLEARVHQELTSEPEGW